MRHGSGGAGSDADRTEDVDALSQRKLTAEVIHAQYRARAFDRGDGTAQRNVAVTLTGIGGVDAGEFQQRGRVTTKSSDQPVEPHQRRSLDQLHVHHDQEDVQGSQDNVAWVRRGWWGLG